MSDHLSKYKQIIDECLVVYQMYTAKEFSIDPRLSFSFVRESLKNWGAPYSILFPDATTFPESQMKIFKMGESAHLKGSPDDVARAFCDMLRDGLRKNNGIVSGMDKNHKAFLKQILITSPKPAPAITSDTDFHP